MNDQQKIEKCVMIPTLIANIPDRKMRFHFCEIFTIYSSETMTAKYMNDAERLSASIDVVKSKLAKESLCRKEARFFESLKEQAREDALNEVITSQVLKPLVYDAVKRLDIEGQERLDAVALAVHDLSKDVHDLSNAFDALNAGKSREGFSRKTGHQEGIVLAPESGSKPQKIPKIDFKHMHLKDFIRKNRSENGDVQ